MAVLGTGQVTLVDLTDGYSVTLTSDSYVFSGTTNKAIAGSTTTQIIAMRGSVQIPASITLSECTVPTGITLSKDTDATAPTLTVTASTSFVQNGTVVIPVHLESNTITIAKKFAVGIAFSGNNGSNGTSVTVSSTSVMYQSSTSATTAPTETWTTAIPTVAVNSYLWTRTIVNYSDGKSTTAYSVSRNAQNGSNGSNGTSVTVSSTSITYQSSTSGTTAPTGTWSSTIPTVAAGNYLWTRTIVTYSDSKSTTSYSVSYSAVDGSDAIVVSITSSNGFTFKNTSISTTLTAHVFRGGAELTAAQISALGTINWYLNASTTSTATGPTLTIDSGDVTNKADYIAKLESA